jgi:hypothetical protein
MIGSIERFRRLIPNRPLVPMMLLVIGVNTTPDPTRKATGYGGILPVPSSPTPAAPAHVDPLLAQQRRDMRAARGRVLYAPGHAPAAQTPTEHARNEHKTPCPEQRVVQSRGPSASPLS